MASAEGVAGPAPHARVGTACASEGRPGEPGRAPGPPPPAVPGGVSVALLAPRSEQGRAGSRWGRLGSCCPCRVGSRGLLHPLSSRTSLGREGRGRTGCHGARRVSGPAPGGSGAPRAPRGGPPRPGTRPQSRQQSRAGGKFPLALCPGTLGAAVPTWAGGSRGQGPGSHSTGSQRGLANRPPTQTREPLCSGGRQRGAGGTEARGGSEAAAPSRADGASSPRAEPRVPGTLRGAGRCRSSRSGVAGPVSAPVVSSRPWAERVKASLCPRKGRGEEGALCAPASSRGPEVQGPSCAKAARAPLSSSARPSEEPCLHSNSPRPCHGDRSQSLELVSRTFTHKHSCVAAQFRGLFRSQGDVSWPRPVTVSPGGPRCQAVRSR